MSEMQEVRRRLAAAKRVLVASHVPPDGDGMGAGIAIVRTVRARGGHAVFAAGGPYQENLSFLVGDGEVDVSPAGPEGAFDLAIALDSGSFARLGALGPRCRACPDFVSIDHHATNENYAALNWVEPAAPATGEMVYRLLKEPGRPLPPEVGLPLYVALVTDTGRFGFSNTGPGAHLMAADLLAAGVEPARVTDEIYRTRPLGFLKLTALAIDAVKIRAGGLLAVITMPPEMIERSGVDPKDAGDVIDVPIGIAGVEVGAIFRETAPGAVKASLRSRRWFSVADFAARYGGGGHHRAAGATVAGTLAEVSARMIGDLETAVAEQAAARGAAGEAAR